MALFCNEAHLGTYGSRVTARRRGTAAVGSLAESATKKRTCFSGNAYGEPMPMRL